MLIFPLFSHTEGKGVCDKKYVKRHTPRSTYLNSEKDGVFPACTVTPSLPGPDHCRLTTMLLPGLPSWALTPVTCQEHQVSESVNEKGRKREEENEKEKEILVNPFVPGDMI